MKRYSLAYRGKKRKKNASSSAMQVKKGRGDQPVTSLDHTVASYSCRENLSHSVKYIVPDKDDGTKINVQFVLLLDTIILL